uniref:Uncharacterized protein n=1 Tax=Arundo donax TaxID=35708 RepID=A0A0A9B4F2_ARUDO
MFVQLLCADGSTYLLNFAVFCAIILLLMALHNFDEPVGQRIIFIFCRSILCTFIPRSY